MAFIRVPFSIEVTVVISIGGKELTWRHYAKKTDGTAPTSADCVNVANGAYNAYLNNWYVVTGGQVQLINVTARSVDEEEGPFGSTTFSLPLIGPGTSDELPNSVAIVCTLGTIYSGRSGRGRTYLAGLVEADVDNNTVNTTILTQGLAYLADIDAEWLTQGFRLYIASKQHNGVPRDPAVTRRVTSYTMNSRVDTQRRRLPKA